MADTNIEAGGESRPQPPGITPRPVLAGERALLLIGGLVLLGMVAVTSVDVLGRYLFNAPLGYAFELTQMGMALLVFCALPSVTLRSEHVTVGLFENWGRGRLQAVRDTIIALLMVVVSLFLAWRLWRLTMRFYDYNDRTAVLGMPTSVFAGLAVVAFALVGVAAIVVMLAAALRIFRRAVQ